MTSSDHPNETEPSIRAMLVASTSMVSTRSTGSKSAPEDSKIGDKRPKSDPSGPKKQAKKAKTEQDGKLAVNDDGEVGLDVGSAAKDEGGKSDGLGKDDEDGAESASEDKEKVTAKPQRPATPSGDDAEPKHGTLESGHIYFLYRPKIDVDNVESIDDVSKFHILLIPKTGVGKSGHYHRIIEVGKKKLPDPDAKRQVIWGLIGGVGTDKSALKEAFGAYSYETKTKGLSIITGTRHQDAARPAGRGHYILHSPRDEVADSPDHSKQRDYKTMLVYEITTPPPEDFGRVQEELGLQDKGAIALSIKDPEAASNNNPRAANMPREKKAHYPKALYDLFGNRRWIPPNPVSFLDYSGGEVLLLSSHHDIAERLGKDGDKIESDLDEASKEEATDISGALKELGMSKGDTEIEALEGAWA